MEGSEVLVWAGLRKQLLHEHTNGSCGWLTGVTAHDSVAVLSFFRSLDNPEKEQSAERQDFLIPPGIDVVGAYAVQGGEDSQAAINKLINEARRAAGCQPVTGAVITGTDVGFYSVRDGAATPVGINTLEGGDLQGWLQERFSFLRCHAPIQLEVFGIRSVPGSDNSTTTATLDRASASAFDSVEESLTGPGSVYILSSSHSPRGRYMLWGKAEAKETLRDLGGTLSEPLQVACFCQRQASTAGIPNTAPVLEYRPAKGGPVSVDRASADVDVLCLVPRGLCISELPEKVIRPALRRQLAAMRAAMLEEGSVCDIRALHFQPPPWPHPVTVIYPLQAAAGKSLEAAEERLLQRRQRLHARLALPPDRPLLRIANALPFLEPRQAATAQTSGAPGGGSSRLSDVHAGLPPSGVPGGRPHLVDGSYDYYHYMQDKFDDNGWGCAYRSLQTICSWFRRQHYTIVPVPSHQQIQQILVDIGDKQRSFVGSKQWIGAIELGYILDSLLGVSSKVITVSSGAEMPSKAREIARHFDTQGTPIMIGGGVLAYTLLGIDHNERTGECAFLILDPHYTGGDDLQAIHRGQWVAWKSPGGCAAAGGDLFVKDAFYNLLCPQRPRTV